MVADGFLSPIDTARAKLQEQIGFFLSNRAKLMRLMDSKTLSVQGQARGLYVVQTQLEDRLQKEITPMLTTISSGVWDSSNILTLAAFTYQLMNQIGAVNSLERQVGVMPAQSMFDFDMGTILLGAIVVGAMGIMSGAFFGRRGKTNV